MFLIWRWQTTHLPPSSTILSLRVTGSWLMVDEDVGPCVDLMFYSPDGHVWCPGGLLYSPFSPSPPPSVLEPLGMDCFSKPWTVSLTQPSSFSGTRLGCCREKGIKMLFSGHCHVFCITSGPIISPLLFYLFVGVAWENYTCSFHKENVQTVLLPTMVSMTL